MYYLPLREVLPIIVQELLHNNTVSQLNTSIFFGYFYICKMSQYSRTYPQTDTFPHIFPLLQVVDDQCWLRSIVNVKPGRFILYHNFYSGPFRWH